MNEDNIKALEALVKNGAKIGQLIMDNHGTMNIDNQVATALMNIIGKNKPIDSKQKWAGAHWFLRWVCNYPAKPQDFCTRINQLPFEVEPEFKCEYNNIRALSTLSFMNEDPEHLESVKYSKHDEAAFFQMREVVVALRGELKKTVGSQFVV